MRIILLFAFCLSFFHLKAQDNDSNTADKYFEAPEESLNSDYIPGWGVGIKAGTLGLGLEVAKSFSQKLDVRAGASFFTLSQDITMDISGQNMDIHTEVDLLAAELMADWYPFNKSSFKLTVGSAYNFNSTLSGVGVITEPYEIGEYIVLQPEDVGEVGVDIIYNSVAPYAGFGFGRAVPKKKLSVGFQAGVYYFGKPSVEMNATELLAPSAENKVVLEQNLDGYRWYPQLSLKISYRIISSI
ncbi:hypothetical protein [Chondrinema litorale]|uniref:hypothetical protein n=1 Tax=Chondrinema litorale TaxID=2994555 RepID=UPI002542C54C|nr:hypothetical protein [Chondrinema litorale]UZR92996.1 hypothetical protein OQ292_14135 [Chondrinema litorale]